MDLTAFYQLLKDKTGVDISAPIAPSVGTSQEVQNSIAGKDGVKGTSDQRTFDREWKQATKPPSIFLQAQRTMAGDTLISKSQTKTM